MTQVAGTREDLHMRIELERTIKAPMQDVFDALLEEIGPSNVTPEGTPIPMVLELRPGGRWYRDLGDDNGHFWGHVQAVKRPALLELTGPLFMSHAVSNNIQYRLTEENGATTLRMTHEAFGMIPENAFDGMPDGWNDLLDRVVRKLT